MILIGVTDDRQILGQEISEKTKRDIGNEIAKISPAPIINILYVLLPNTNKYVIALHVAIDSTKKPYLYDGRAYMRIQSDTLLMPREYLQHLMLSNTDPHSYWEDNTLENISITDLNTDEILTTLKEGVFNGRIPESYSTQDPLLALQRLSLINDNKITNAALVLFGKAPQKIFPQCLLRLARFKGTTKSEFIDNKQVTGNIFDLIRAALMFVNTHLPIASIFPEGEIRRKDIPLFPIIALREAIANAMCHRDYSYQGGSVSLAIFDDRVEIWSYGLLPPGVNLSEIRKLNQSVPRNRRISNVLYYHKLFESWGRGIQLILDECKKAGHPEPFYMQQSGGILLTLPSSQAVNAKLSSLDPESKALNKWQLEIITLLNKYAQLSVEEMHRYLNNPPSMRWLRSELLHLRELGYVNYIGETRSRRWFLNK
jgi:ATP-dependent DNA helicase RecG